MSEFVSRHRRLFAWCMVTILPFVVIYVATGDLQWAVFVGSFALCCGLSYALIMGSIALFTIQVAKITTRVGQTAVDIGRDATTLASQRKRKDYSVYDRAANVDKPKRDAGLYTLGDDGELFELPEDDERPHRADSKD